MTSVVIAGLSNFPQNFTAHLVFSSIVAAVHALFGRVAATLE